MESTTKPSVKLIGEDGNAFNIIARCQRAARDAGWSKDRIDSLQADMMSGNYDHLLQVALDNFEVH